MIAPRRRGWPRQFARLMLWCYPRQFRERFGVDFTCAMDAVAGEPRHAGTRGALRMLWLVLGDVARTAPGEWLYACQSPPPLIDRPLTSRDRMDSLVQDIRYAVRSFRRSPLFVAVVAGSLALGIGANALVFSVLDGIILRPFAFRDPDRLVAVGASFPKVSPERQYLETLSSHEFTDIKAGTPSLEHVVAFDLGNRAISGGDVPERVFTAFVWGDPLQTLGLTPALGRSFRDDETTTPGARVAVISHRLWQSRFGGDSSVVGRAVRVNGEPHTVIGVLPAAALLLGTDLWTPMGVDPQVIPRRARQFAVLGRIREGGSLSQVNAELRRVAEQTTTAWLPEHDVYERWSLEAAPWHVALTSEDGVRSAGFLLQGAVFLILIIAWVNVAGLLVARANVRQGELVTRRALGAGSGRITRQLVTEGVLLSLIGAVVGLAACLALATPINSALPDQIRGLGIAVRVNGRVLLVTLGASVLVGTAFAAVPSGQFLRRGKESLLGQLSARTTTNRGSQKLRALFQGTQVALSVVLLAAAGLLVQSMTALSRVDVGFEPRQVLTMRVTVPREKFADSSIVPFIERLQERVLTIPGVRAVGATTQYGLPNFQSAPISLPGEPVGRDASRRVDVTNVTTSLLPTLGYRLQMGRLFGETDTERAPAVAVLNATAARKWLGGINVLGRRLVIGDSARSAEVEVVGVVADARNRGLDAPVEPEVFIPARQSRVGWNNQYFLLVRGEGDVMALLPSVRAAIRDVDADQPVYAINTVERQLGAAMIQRTATMVFLVAFSGIALLLASAGVYGMVSYAVSQRTREIGIRMALGADASRVRRLILMQTLQVVGGGAVVGVIAAVAGSGALGAVVYGVSPTDPLTLAAAVGVLSMVCLGAALPAIRQATRVPPVAVLRD